MAHVADEIVSALSGCERSTSEHTTNCVLSSANSYRKYECTICKTITPSLFFSRSPEVTFPTDHHLPSSPASRIAAAQAGSEKLEKGKNWFDGLVLPGTLDLDGFLFTDKKLSVVFDDEELVSCIAQSTCCPS